MTRPRAAMLSHPAAADRDVIAIEFVSAERCRQLINGPPQSSAAHALAGGSCSPFTRCPASVAQPSDAARPETTPYVANRAGASVCCSLSLLLAEQAKPLKTKNNYQCNPIASHHSRCLCTRSIVSAKVLTQNSPAEITRSSASAPLLLAVCLACAWAVMFAGTSTTLMI